MAQKNGHRILVVDDEVSICEVLSIALEKDGYTVETETNPRDALKKLQSDRFDVVIEDLKMPEMDGIELLREIKKTDPDTIVIIMTAYTTWDRAVQAMRLGAYDYVRKPFDTQVDIKSTVARALQNRTAQLKLAQTLDIALQDIGLIIGYSKGMRTVRDLIQRAAPTDSTVLVHGESGVGKELVARALHYGSARMSKPFVAVNCGALTETLLESELFGHIKGAFTGAVLDKTGLVEAAHEGTLFLDEVSEMTPQLQVKLLRLLEEKEFKPVGGVKTRKVDVRFITATNRRLEEEVRKNTFRKDLFYRLNVIPIHVPPLRERTDDIPVLSDYFLGKYTKEMNREGKVFSPAAKKSLMEFPWPGNIRELENSIQRAIALSDSDEIGPESLFEGVRDMSVAPGTVRRVKGIPEGGMDLEREMEGLEIEYIKQALEKTGGNYTKAAQLLRVSLRSFRYKIQKYELEK